MTPEQELQLGLAKIRYAAEVEAAKATATGEVRVAELRYAEPARQATRRTMWNATTSLALIIIHFFVLTVVPKSAQASVMIGQAIFFVTVQALMMVREIFISRR